MAHSDKTLSGILSGLTDLFTSKFTKTCMTSLTVKDRVERRVSRVSEIVGKSAFSSIFGEKTELKNELKRFALLAESSDVLPLPSNFTGSCYGFCFRRQDDQKRLEFKKSDCSISNIKLALFFFSRSDSLFLHSLIFFQVLSVFDVLARRHVVFLHFCTWRISLSIQGGVAVSFTMVLGIHVSIICLRFEFHSPQDMLLSLELTTNCNKLEFAITVRSKLKSTFLKL